MNIQKIAFKAVSTALLVPALIGGLFAQTSKADLIPSLPGGGEGWVSYNLAKGDYLIEASTLFSLGDVDLEIYDSSNRLIARSNKWGTERIRLSAAYRDTFHIRYTMPICANPIGDCAVNLDIFEL